MALGVLAALLVTWMIIQLVFTFGWFASGLAADKIDEERRRDAPIDIEFHAAPVSPADSNNAAADPNTE